MNKDLERVIEVPVGIKVSVDGKEVTVSKDSRELKKKFNFGKVKLFISDSKLKLSVKNATRRESKMMGTINAHLKNMVAGVQEDFEYVLEICNVHFPMNVKADKNTIVIKSFLGETTTRVSKVLPGVNVDIKGSKIVVKSSDIEAAGQTAANLEKATKSKGRDRRIFQDGIFITNKPGREI